MIPLTSVFSFFSPRGSPYQFLLDRYLFCLFLTHRMIDHSTISWLIFTLPANMFLILIFLPLLLSFLHTVWLLVPQVRALQVFYDSLSADPDRACYSFAHCQYANQQLAIESLSVSILFYSILSIQSSHILRYTTLFYSMLFLSLKDPESLFMPLSTYHDLYDYVFTFMRAYCYTNIYIYAFLYIYIYVSVSTLTPLLSPSFIFSFSFSFLFPLKKIHPFFFLLYKYNYVTFHIDFFSFY